MCNENIKKDITKIEVKDALKIIGGGVFMAGTIVMSYKLGCKFTEFKIGYSIRKCCEVDPALEEHLWSAINKVKELNN